MTEVSINRCAIYFAPRARSALWSFGSSVLGYDAETGLSRARPDAAFDWPELNPRAERYGLHATLKPPFHLAAGVTTADVTALAAEVARRLAPVALRRLVVAELGRFIALVPEADDPALGDLALLAQDLVVAFEPLRAALSAADDARLRAKPLTPRQVANLEAFGYPYVDQDFGLHLTLTDALHQPHRAAVRSHLASLHGRVAEDPYPIDEIAVFEQPDRDSRFRIVSRHRLTA
jgi:hypothetical protein